MIMTTTMSTIVFPANAGMNRSGSQSWTDISRVPRKRGDEPIAMVLMKRRGLCSPQTRG